MDSYRDFIFCCYDVICFGFSFTIIFKMPVYIFKKIMVITYHDVIIKSVRILSDKFCYFKRSLKNVMC